MRAARPRADTYLFFLVSFTLIVALTHLPYIDLPFFWDELGQFVPAALDLYRHGLWVARSTVPNVHPPGLMAYLAGVWHIFGYSIPATRAAMLLAGGFCAFLTFLLAIRLCRGAGGAPAFSAVALLVFSPLFYTQAMMAQLDLPAAMFTVWALLWFLEGRYRGAALVCVALALTKETGLVAAAVFAAWLWREGKRREAAWFALPALALAGWLAALAVSTGHLLGNREFAEYNVFYPLHPLRLGMALLRRLFYLFLDNFHWIGWIAVWAAWRRARLFAGRDWQITASFAAVHVLAVTVAGGATLERYLLPVLPLMYIAMAAGWSVYSPGWRRFSETAMLGGLIFSLFWIHPYPEPFENNLAMVDFVRLHQNAAQYLERNCESRTITTAWPLSGALRRPEFGYVRQGLRVREVRDFGASTLASLDPASLDVVVLYTREWDPGLLFDRFPALREWRTKIYGFEPQVSPEYLKERFGMEAVASWSSGGQWISILERRAGAVRNAGRAAAQAISGPL